MKHSREIDVFRRERIANILRVAQKRGVLLEPLYKWLATNLWSVEHDVETY
jgi:hypothetical protein